MVVAQWDVDCDSIHVNPRGRANQAAPKKCMKAEKYLGYRVEICKADNTPLAVEIGESMQGKFRGARYTLVEGEPAGKCLRVEGPDPRTCEHIKEWVDSNL